MDQGTCSLTWLGPVIIHFDIKKVGKHRVGRSQYNPPFWQQSEQIQCFAKLHPELSRVITVTQLARDRRKIIVPSNQKHRNLV